MLLPPRFLQARRFADADSVCLQCLYKLSRSPTPRRRPLSTSAPFKNAVAATRQQRNVFKKEYFWGNSILEDVLLGSRRGVQSDATSMSMSKSNGDEDTPPITTMAKESPDSAPQPSPVSTSTLIKDELPHRRRKRLREEATAASTADPIIPHDASSRLSTAASALPATSIRRLLTTYLSLSKPRLSFLVVLTTCASYSLYPVPAILSSATAVAPSLSTLTLLYLTTGTALSCASANALNMLFEPSHDAKMSRTRNRPLVRKLISPRGALAFAVFTGIAGVGLLYYGTNPTVAFLSALNIVLYAGIYTPMKRISVLNTWAGALVGGIPPLMGWAAAAGQCAAHEGNWEELLFGEGSAGGWLLAGLLFTWQFPHFNALSWTIRDEYKNAGYRMLAWTNPARNARVALRYSLLMFPLCIAFSYAGVTDWGFAVTSSVINGWMLREAIRFWRYEGAKGSARGLFWASVWHLPIVLVLAMAHKKGLWEKVWRAAVGDAGEEEWEYDDEEPEQELGRGSETGGPTR
ncbi:protoheme IX farnesyltransferase mitochondrial precursor [Cryomyces antarcticus]